MFVSYDREDTVKEFVRKLKRDLEGAHLSVWLDKEDIPAGLEKPVLAIRIALRDCKAGCRCNKEVHLYVVLQERVVRCMWKKEAYFSRHTARWLGYVVDRSMM